MSNTKPRFKEVDLNFRKTVDPAQRRQTNKELFQLSELKERYNATTAESTQLKVIVDAEAVTFKAMNAKLEEARNELADAQSEIDMDYLPEGAQPRLRITKRDKILMEVNQQTAALAAQKEVVMKWNAKLQWRIQKDLRPIKT